MSISVDLRPGSVLLGYRIERVLGRGGMGVVYLAHQLVLDRMVALKLLAPELAEGEAFRTRFLRESRLAASLDHPSIVPIFDAGEVEGHLYIAMRYVEGTDLARLLSEQAPLEPARALALLGPVADALDAAQASGLVHRDVKPSNILVDGADRPYLADFGLSKETSDRGLVEASHFAASVDYVAPEQVARQSVGPAADIYALGCVLYECLTGTPPFRASSVMATLFGHVSDERPAASERNSELPGAIDAVLARALAREPDERHPTSGELIADAEEALGLSEVTAAPGRRWLVVAGLGVALLAATGVVAFLLVRGGGSGDVGRSDLLVRIDPQTNRVTGRVPAGRGVAGVATGAGAVWVSSQEDGSVWRIDARTHRLRRIPGFPEPGDVAVGSSSIYVGFRDGVGEIDSVGLNRSSITIGLGTSGQRPGVAGGPFGIWATDQTSPSAVRLLLTSALGRTGVVERVPIERVGNEARAFDTLTGIAEGEGAVWVTGDALEPALFRIDPATHRIDRIRLPSAPGKVAAGAGAVWVTGQIEDVVWRVNPRSRMITDTIQVGRGSSGVAVGAGGVWVASAIDATVGRIDSNRRKLVATIAVDGPPQGIAVGEGGVWVVTRVE